MWSSRIDTVDRGSVFLVEENSMEVNLRLQGGEVSQWAVPVSAPVDIPHGREPAKSLFSYFGIVSWADVLASPMYDVHTLGLECPQSNRQQLENRTLWQHMSEWGDFELLREARGIEEPDHCPNEDNRKPSFTLGGEERGYLWNIKCQLFTTGLFLLGHVKVWNSLQSPVTRSRFHFPTFGVSTQRK